MSADIVVKPALKVNKHMAQTLGFRGSEIRPGEAFHIVRGDLIVADLYWDASPIPTSNEGHPFGWVMRWRDTDGGALVESPDYDPEPKAIMLDEGGDNELDRSPE